MQIRDLLLNERRKGAGSRSDSSNKTHCIDIADQARFSGPHENRVKLRQSFSANRRYPLRFGELLISFGYGHQLGAHLGASHVGNEAAPGRFRVSIPTLQRTVHRGERFGAHLQTKGEEEVTSRRKVPVQGCDPNARLDRDGAQGHVCTLFCEKCARNTQNHFAILLSI